MTVAHRRRRLGIAGKLLILSVALAAIPILTLRHVHETQAFVLAGQRNALELGAQAVATVLHGREELFRDVGGLPFSPWEENDCSPVVLDAPILLDGNGRDWPSQDERGCTYTRNERLRGGNAARRTVGFHLVLGQRGKHLYALFRVADDAVVFRHPRHRNLDASDHLRLTIPFGGDAGDLHYVVTAEEPGPVSAYPVGDAFRYAQAGGLPEPRIQGTWSADDAGYTVELRLPLDMLPERQIGFAIADVDARAGALEAVVGTMPSGAASERIRLVLLDSPDIVRILAGLELPGARISIRDQAGRLRAVVGDASRAVDARPPPALFDAALVGETRSMSDTATTIAVSPIRAGADVVGAVVMERSNDDVLAVPRAAVERERDTVVAACGALAVVLWLFASRVAWRIRRLRDDAETAIDDDGRPRRAQVAAGSRAGDEIGDLSRTISGLLTRLSHYTAFLEELPRTLRHEISNPLNTLSTSLQNLAAERPDVADSKYLRSAERGVARIGEIVIGLTEAASLEEALREDDPETLDLSELVSRYVENVAAGCPLTRFTVRGAETALPIRASGFRIEQLLDKLVDNALRFSPDGGAVELTLAATPKLATLDVRNEGPPIPAAVTERLFEACVATRSRPGLPMQDGACESPPGDGPHLGIGLYVVRLIVEHAGGRVSASNGSGGPTFHVELPLDRTGEGAPQPALRAIQ